MNVKLFTKDIVDNKQELWMQNIDTEEEQYICNFSQQKETKETLEKLQKVDYRYFSVNTPTYNPLTLLSLIADKQSIQSINCNWDDTNEFRGSLFGYSDEYVYGFYYVIFDKQLYQIIKNIITYIKNKNWQKAYGLAALYENVYSIRNLSKVF